MSEPAPPTTALERPPVSPVPGALMDDDEIRRTYRIAEALWQSGAYKDVKRAETAFAKMVIGRDLGLSPAQAMSGIHLVEGGVQMHYAMLGQFVRSREGYDYRAGWLKDDQEPGGSGPEVVVVWHDEEAADDLRPIIGAVAEFWVGGERRGVSRFTLDDARAANLIKSSEKAAWNTAPRNMLLARAMSNGVKWFVPEVLGGMPVYVDGELERGDRKSLTAGTTDPASDADAEPRIELGPAVEKLIERAAALGHRGLSNRVAVELAVGNRAPGVVKDWVARAKAELDRFEAEKAAAAEATEEPVAEEVHGHVVDEPADEAAEDPRDRLSASGEVEVEGAAGDA